MGLKTCYKCHISYSFEEFYKDKRLKSGLSARCKHCHEQKRAKYRENDSMRYYHIKRRYGITKDQYLEMLKSQDGKCYLCKSNNSRFFSRSSHLVVDHDHNSNKIRKLLCSPCNILVGRVEQSGGLEFLKKIIEYLK